MPNVSAAAGALGVSQSFAPSMATANPFQKLLDQQNNDQLLKQKRKNSNDPLATTDANGNTVAGPYSSSQAYRDLLGVY